MDGQQQYVGRFTAINLDYVEREIVDLDGIRARKALDNKVRCLSTYVFDADYVVSIHETLAILERGVKKSPRAWIALQKEYALALSDIAHYPERYTTPYLTPEIAQAWYEQQIEAIRQQLSSRGVA